MPDENALPAQHRREDDTQAINVSPRNLALAALLFLGGAGGGGIGSGLLGGNLEKEVASVGEVVQDLKRSVEIIGVSMVEIKTELKADRRANEKIEKKVQDHEERIRALETKRGR